MNPSCREKAKPQSLHIESHCLEAQTVLTLGFQFEHIHNFYFSKIFRNTTIFFFNFIYILYDIDGIFFLNLLPKLWWKRLLDQWVYKNYMKYVNLLGYVFSFLTAGKIIKDSPS